MARPVREQQHPLIRDLADRIEAVWHQYLDLSPYALPDDLGYVEGRLEGEKLLIENCCYQAPQFRKMHLEVAKVGRLLDILHCVMFPRIEYPLPMFGTDLIGGRGEIRMAIVDLSPVTGDRKLSPAYQADLQALPPMQFEQPRELPDWGDIFSPFCLLVSPTSAIEGERFIRRVEQFLEVHCRQANAVYQAGRVASEQQQQEVAAGQRYYCSQQQQNDKTRRVLERAFGMEWADRYMTTVLFDMPFA